MKAHGKTYFIGVESVKGSPLHEKSTVHEVEHPFRYCPQAHFWHVWPGKAVVVGKWQQKTKSLDEHILDALRGNILVFKEEKQRFS